MANYFIGDIQGCYSGLRQALAAVEFNKSKDTLWLTGDLIARGPESLQTIKFLYKHQDSIKTVLGNHDLHLLAVANGIKQANPKDLLSDLLNCKKLNTYVDWLRQYPLLLELPKQQGFMSHAGLAPNWTTDDAVYWNSQIQQQLTSDNYQTFLTNMYGNAPTIWNDALPEDEKFRFAINAFTRMRYCTNSGELEFKQKGAPDNLNNEFNRTGENYLMPWFEFQPNRFDNIKWIFGHWASLMGQTNNDNIIGLDTGYVWGNYLSMYRLKTNKLTFVHYQ